MPVAGDGHAESDAATSVDKNIPVPASIAAPDHDDSSVLPRGEQTTWQNRLMSKFLKLWTMSPFQKMILALMLTKVVSILPFDAKRNVT